MKVFVLLLLLFGSPLSMSGLDQDILQVMHLASRYLGTTTCSIVKSSNSYCVIQRCDSDGFVIIARDANNNNKVIGYSTSSWVEHEMPLTLLNWLNSIDTISFNLTRNTLPCRTKNINKKVTISPLLTSHWHQGSPYNDLSPVISDGNVKTAAGCVAVAAAQIAYYWRKDNPSKTLRDTPVYPYGAAPIENSIPKGTPNNWDLMKDSYTVDDSPDSRYAAAQLCYVLGTTSYLNYASSTGGSIYDASNALYSQFDLISEYTTKGKQNQQEWEELLYDQIERGRPILCAGSDGNGHAFVLDGYDSESNLYHFNFGWGGSGDGYYPIDDTELSMGGYYKNQSVVYNILPKNRNIDASMIVESLNETESINIEVSITNNSTLDLRCLNAYLVRENNTIQDVVDPIWQYNNIIKCDGITQQILIRDININSCSNIYLTDENKYVLSNLYIKNESGINSIMSNQERDCSLYDIQGNRVETPKRGLYLLRKNNKTIKIIK
jgi:hypothetical protein